MSPLRKCKKALLWPMVLLGCLGIIAAFIVGSYFYFGQFADKVTQKIENPKFDAENSLFLQTLLRKPVGEKIFAQVVLEAESTGDFGTVKREINEWLFLRFGKDIAWNLYINGQERADNQIIGFVSGRTFSAYLPTKEGPLKIDLEVNADAWANNQKPYLQELQ